MGDIEDVVRFGTEISWFTSLVPVHVTTHGMPRGFRTFDQYLKFTPNEFPAVDSIIERVRVMRTDGFLLYDSDQYLDDIKRFVKGDATTWRDRNHGICDSPNLYFALLPNGEFAPCCDHRLELAPEVYSESFPGIYKDRTWRKKVAEVTKACEGCMYGSYPEMTIAMRFFQAKLERVRTFFTAPPRKTLWPLTYGQLFEIAQRIRSETRERPASRFSIPKNNRDSSCPRR
jgi:hypothetical protein